MSARASRRPAAVGDPTLAWLPHAFDGLIATALAKDPDERFSSCGDLVHAARNAASGQRLVAPRPSATPARTIASAATLPEAHPGPETSPTFTPSRKSRTLRNQSGGREGGGGDVFPPAKLLPPTLALVVVASAASGAAVYFLRRATLTRQRRRSLRLPNSLIHPLSALVPAPVWHSCKLSRPPRSRRRGKRCLPSAQGRHHLSLQLSSCRLRAGRLSNARTTLSPTHRVGAILDAEGASWGGEGTWLHNASAPGSEAGTPADPGSVTSMGTRPSSSGRTARPAKRPTPTCSDVL